MKIYSILKYKLVYVFLILLFLLSFIDNNLYLFINLIISIFYMLFFCRESKYDWRYWFVICLLGGIVIIGLTRFNNTWYDYGKDLFYFIKPMVFFTLGYILIQNISVKNIVKIVVYLVLIFAIIHTFSAVYYLLHHPFDTENIRNALGRGYILEVLAIYFILLKKESSFSFASQYKIIYLLIIFTSCLLSFSRTNIVVLLVLLLFAFSKISLKQLYYIPICILFVSGILLYNYQEFNGNKKEIVGKVVDKKEVDKKEIDKKENIEIFFEKIENSREEVFAKDIDEESLSEIYAHWRAYEVKCAFEQTKDIIIGNGFGALVDIHFYVFLGKESMRFIPILHNGYAYIIFKTGIIGCVLYVFFVLIQFWKRRNILDVSIYYFQIGLAASIMLTTFVVTGIYGKTDLTILFLGMILGLQLKKTHK